MPRAFVEVDACRITDFQERAPQAHQIGVAPQSGVTKAGTIEIDEVPLAMAVDEQIVGSAVAVGDDESRGGPSERPTTDT